MTHQPLIDLSQVTVGRSSAEAFKATPATPLHDIQGQVDTRQVPLNRVGIKNVDVPLTLIQKNGRQQVVAASATMSVGLQAECKGTHMSRFVLQLAEWSLKKPVSINMREFLQETLERLNAPSAQADLRFKYFVDKPAPISRLTAPMGYDCQFSARMTTASPTSAPNSYQFCLGLDVPMSTLCPCSKAISDFGAHNQRAIAHVKLLLDTVHEDEHPLVWIEDVITQVEECASCPVYPLLKRVDEKYVTERQYTNAKFVEDVIRDITVVFRQFPGVQGFSIEVEALESIHAHNAWAAHAENFQFAG
ncbi:MAG: GTP cyclohydrolase FolE2 [Candidatus Melainabacteria bacterium]|nr:GTP cyclohydrolase FolE2 [Candidatus Melainabacteria bacterium]